MSASAIRAVFFDAVGTLIHPEPEAAAVYVAAGRRHGSRLGKTRIAAAFREALARQDSIDRQQDWRTSEARELLRWQTIVAEVLHDVVDSDACFRELYEHFGQRKNWRCDAAAGPVIDELLHRGYLVGLASNFDGRLRRVVADMPELAGINDIVISSEVGWRKPSPRFFATAGQTVAQTPQAILYVGDDPANDYEGAIAAGWQAVLFDPRAQAAGAANRIATLTEVLALLLFV
jgi:putative hydrolase of the HAD superfamily